VSDPGGGETALRLERLIPSPREVLFALWMEPAQLVKWWAPDGYEALVHDLDVQPGGRWRIGLRRPDGGMATTSGVYRIVEPPRRLAFTWAWEDEHGTRGPESEVTVSFETAPGGTHIVLQHKRFESRQARDRHNAGWSACFDRQATITA